MTFDSIDEDLLEREGEEPWELYHENSKTSRHERRSAFALPPSDASVVRVMKRLRTVKPYRDRPKIPLPTELPSAEKSLDEVMVGRTTARVFGPGEIGFEQLAKVLYMGYGLIRDNAGTPYPRPFRAVPSGGALYPLEIYLHATRVRGLSPGLYHYDPEDETLDVLRPRDESAAIAGCMIQRDLAADAAAILLVSAIFLRSTFKYGDRGYRFVLLEAGHVCQNATLSAQEMGLATAPVGGYLDRDLDRHLGFDGLTESVVYVLLIGQPAHGAAPRQGEPDDATVQ